MIHPRVTPHLAAAFLLAVAPLARGQQGDPAPGSQAPPGTSPAAAPAPQASARPNFDTSTRAGAALASLSALLERRAELEAELSTLNSTQEEERKQREIDQVEAQIEALATGVSESEYGGEEGGGFDLNTELESLLEPFVAMMKDATEDARQIERLRRSAAEAQRRRAMADRALAALRPLLASETSGELRDRLLALETEWKKRSRNSGELAVALQQQIEARKSESTDTRAAAEEAASAFFRDRGLSLIYGFGTFAIVFTLLRLASRTIERVRRRRRPTRSFGARLFDIAFLALAFVGATGAMLAVFNLRQDWLLLGASGLLLLALAWAGIKMIPGAIEQVTLLLNLGAVQEGERILKDGVPYRVERLDVYTELDNPRLEGARTILPVRELIGLHSRPSGPNEPWFPTRRGHFVRLGDGVRGTVISQSPEHVELQIAGGSHVTYTTPDFLAACPDNLSDGFRAEITFGIGYVHQAESTGKIIDTLREHVAAGLEEIVPKEQIRDVSVEMLEAGDSAIVYEVEADLTGDAAPKIEAVERSLTRLCIDACNVYGWEIPFPQMVVHRVQQGATAIDEEPS